MKKMIYTMIALLLMGAILAGCAKAEPAETKDGAAETQMTTETQAPAISEEVETPAPERPEADITVSTLDMFIAMIYDSLREPGTLDDRVGPQTYSIGYGDFTYVSYFASPEVKEQGYQYQIWYQDKLILGPETLSDECERFYRADFGDIYTVRYEKSAAIIICFCDDYYYGKDNRTYDIRAFDTKGNVLCNEVSSAFYFYEEIASLFYDTDTAKAIRVSFVESLDGEPFLGAYRHWEHDGLEDYAEYVRAQNPDAFLDQLCDSACDPFAADFGEVMWEWPYCIGPKTNRVAYQDLSYVAYFTNEKIPYGYQYQVWYQDKLIMGPEILDDQRTVPYLSIFWTNYYMVTYENTEVFVIISQEKIDKDGGDYDIRVFDTKGNVLFNGLACGDISFDMESATLSFNRCVSNASYPHESEPYSLSLQNSVDGEPMIAVKAGPSNENPEMETIPPYKGKKPVTEITRNADAFYKMICGDYRPVVQNPYRVAYQDLIYVIDYNDPEMPYSHQYQIWYRDKLIADSKEVFSPGSDFNMNRCQYAMVKYENSAAFMLYSVTTVDGELIGLLHVFDTSGNLLLEEKVDTWDFLFDVETATLTYDVSMVTRTFSLQNSPEGEPMIEVKTCFLLK